MIIDFHTHAFKDNLAVKAIPNLQKTCGIQAKGDGTLGCLKKAMREQGVDKAVVLNIAVTPHAVRSVNDWALEINGTDGVAAFGSVHPDFGDIPGELARIKAGGIKGVKLHPCYQEFFVEEERAFPMYEALEESGLFVTFHAGYDPLTPSINYASVKGFAKVRKRFPNMRMILAHMGGMNEFKEARELLWGQDLYIDTALAEGGISRELLLELIEKHGADKVLLGSDYPWHNPSQEIGYIRSLGLCKDAEERILGGNALRIFE